MKIQYYLRITVAFLISACAGSNNNKNEKFGQSDSNTNQKIGTPKIISKVNSIPETPEEKTDEISVIRQKFKDINGGKYQLVSYQAECKNSPNTIKITKYLDEAYCVKIVVDWGFAGDYGRLTEYYYSDGKLIFEYEEVNGGPADRPVTTVTQRNYFAKDKNILFLNNGKKEICANNCILNANSMEYKLIQINSNDEIASILGE